MCKTRSLPSDSLSKLFLISARNGVSSFTTWFSCASPSLDGVCFPCFYERFTGSAHPIEELARRVYSNYFGREPEIRKYTYKSAYVAIVYFVKIVINIASCF